MGMVTLWQPSNVICTLCGLFHILRWKIKYDDDDDVYPLQSRPLNDTWFPDYLPRYSLTKLLRNKILYFFGRV